jgi:biopolymer transport protein ExbD
MAMSVQQDGGDDGAPMSEINTTPLVDVMLVLLIVFMITIPVITHTVPVELPKVHNVATETKPENVNLSVNKEGQVFWNQSLIPDSNALLERLKAVAVSTMSNFERRIRP